MDGGSVNINTLPDSATYSDTVGWAHQGSCRQAHYESSTSALKCTFQKVLPATFELQERFEDLSADWRKFGTAAFLKLALQTALPNAGELLLTHAAGKIASATLVTVAQMLHIINNGCMCDLDDVFEEEAYQLELRRHLMAILPPSEKLKPRLHRPRARYAFALLESAILTLEKPVDQLLLYLKKDERSKKASEYLTSSLDQMSDCHDSFIGPWAWNCIVSKLTPTLEPSPNAASIGRPEQSTNRRIGFQGGAAPE